MSRNYSAINEYLDSLGIDARRIPEDSVTAQGYTLWPDPDRDKVRYGTDAVNPVGSQLGVPWPNPEVYKNVVLLMNGATLDEILPPEERPKAEKKTTPVKNEPETAKRVEGSKVNTK